MNTTVIKSNVDGLVCTWCVISLSYAEEIPHLVCVEGNQFKFNFNRADTSLNLLTTELLNEIKICFSPFEISKTDTKSTFASQTSAGLSVFFLHNRI